VPPPPPTRLPLRAICETCSFFATTIELRLTLRAQHDHAVGRGQHERIALYQNLLTRLDDQTA